MLKKLLAVSALVAAVSVPLAGVSWADQPDDPGLGAGGVPGRNAVVQ
jgi:hypothetical protein